MATNCRCLLCSFRCSCSAGGAVCFSTSLDEWTTDFSELWSWAGAMPSWGTGLASISSWRRWTGLPESYDAEVSSVDSVKLGHVVTRTDQIFEWSDQSIREAFSPALQAKIASSAISTLWSRSPVEIFVVVPHWRAATPMAIRAAARGPWHDLERREKFGRECVGYGRVAASVRNVINAKRTWQALRCYRHIDVWYGSYEEPQARKNLHV